MQEQLEALTVKFLNEFEVTAAPVPIEAILQSSKAGFWDYLDISQLSGTFMKLTHPYSPRMSLARMLARHVISSEWGQAQNLPALVGQDEDDIHAFARMITMPRPMVMALSASSRTPSTLSMRFEVPEDDARQRLVELGEEVE